MDDGEVASRDGYFSVEKTTGDGENGFCRARKGGEVSGRKITTDGVENLWGESVDGHRDRDGQTCRDSNKGDAMSQCDITCSLSDAAWACGAAAVDSRLIAVSLRPSRLISHLR